MKLFTEEELSEVRDVNISKLENVDYSDLERLFDYAVNACESKLTQIVMDTPNDQELGEKLRSMYKAKSITVKTSMTDIAGLDLSDLLEKFDIDADVDDIISVQLISEKNMSPVLTFLIRENA